VQGLAESMLRRAPCCNTSRVHTGHVERTAQRVAPPASAELRRCTLCLHPLSKCAARVKTLTAGVGRPQR
jgi:hypothetical protein